MGAGVNQKTGAGRRRGRRSRHAAMSEINVTPFVDVMLVLLIVFMVSAPLMTVGVPVQLPETAAEPLPGDQDEEPLAVTMTEDGRIMIQTSWKNANLSGIQDFMVIIFCGHSDLFMLF